MQEEDAQSNRDINFQIVKGEHERRGLNAPNCLSVCGCLFERVCDTFTSSLLCHDYHHACSLSKQRSYCVPLVRLNCTAFYIITTWTLSALPTHSALHTVQCVADCKDLLSRTRLDHRVVMPATAPLSNPLESSLLMLGLWSPLSLQSVVNINLQSVNKIYIVIYHVCGTADHPLCAHLKKKKKKLCVNFLLLANFKCGIKFLCIPTNWTS